MSDVTIKRIEEFDTPNNGGFCRARATLGVSAFGMQVENFPPHFEHHPEHDHSDDGQEEVYTALSGLRDAPCRRPRVPARAGRLRAHRGRRAAQGDDRRRAGAAPRDRRDARRGIRGAAVHRSRRSPARVGAPSVEVRSHRGGHSPMAGGPPRWHACAGGGGSPRPDARPRPRGGRLDGRPPARASGPSTSTSCRRATSPVPPGENIQAWLAHVEAGRFEDAWRTIVVDNPLAAIHGRVCYHPCEDSCNRAQLDSTVSIHSIERFLGDHGDRERMDVRSAGGARPASGC